MFQRVVENLRIVTLGERAGKSAGGRRAKEKIVK